MAVTVKFNSASKIRKRLGIDPKGEVQKYFTKRAADYMDKYVPYNEGNLAYSTRKIGIDKITYEAPYAHYMYEGKVYGPNIPFKDEGGNIYFRSPKKKTKKDTGRELKYKKTAGHEYAGAKWDERMKSAELDDLLQEVEMYIRLGGNK